MSTKPPTEDRPVIVFTEDKYNALLKRYEQAVKDNEEVFTFEGHEILTRYAKYLLMYLAGQLIEGKWDRS